ncbi:MAG: glycoside hydrolase family 28 protein [Treponema sp.]|jgi:polygalacturonase|nr:glycoside hydrolase family 28 protein [Treponema sp.]
MRIETFGARGDGQTDNSSAFAAAFKCARERGGAVISVGNGVWRTGPLTLFSYTTLCLEAGAVISFIPEPARYRPVLTRWEGVECYAMHPCLFASGQEDIALTGTGTLDGNGQVWWDMLRQKRAAGQRAPETALEQELAERNKGYQHQAGGGGGRNMQFLRPPLVQFYKSSALRLEGITLCNSPFWTLHPVYCDNLVIQGISITNPPDAPNTDGMDIDSCQNVRISDCYLSVGDDGIAIKSGSGEDGLRVNEPSRVITVRHCMVENAHGGVVIGSETAGGVSAVQVEDCVFRGTDRGIRIKTRRGRGGAIHDLSFRSLIMEDNLCPLAINMYYRCGAGLSDDYFSLEPQAVSLTTPSIQNITVSDVHATACRASAGFIAGLPESPVSKVRISHCDFATDEASEISPDESDMFLGIPPVQEKSFRILNTQDIELTDVQVRGPVEAFLYR